MNVIQINEENLNHLNQMGTNSIIVYFKLIAFEDKKTKVITGVTYKMIAEWMSESGETATINQARSLVKSMAKSGLFSVTSEKNKLYFMPKLHSWAVRSTDKGFLCDDKSMQGYNADRGLDRKSQEMDIRLKIDEMKSLHFRADRLDRELRLMGFTGKIDHDWLISLGSMIDLFSVKLIAELKNGDGKLMDKNIKYFSYILEKINSENIQGQEADLHQSHLATSPMIRNKETDINKKISNEILTFIKNME